MLVECGKDLTQKMILNNLFNEFYLFKGNKYLTGKGKKSVLNIKNSVNKVFKNKTFINTYLDKDRLIHYY